MIQEVRDYPEPIRPSVTKAEPTELQKAVARSHVRVLIIGILIGVALMVTVALATGTAPSQHAAATPTPAYADIDMNRDGKVTLTDLVLAKRAEIRIKAELLGEPDPFITGTNEEP